MGAGQAGKQAEQQAVYANRRREAGRERQEFIAAARRVGRAQLRALTTRRAAGGVAIRGHENILKRQLIHVGTFLPCPHTLGALKQVH